MIDHLAGHAAVDADVLACNKASLVGAEVQHHVGDVHRVTHSTRWLLNGIGALINGAGGVDPTRRDAVNAHLAGKADGQGVSEGGNAA